MSTIPNYGISNVFSDEQSDAADRFNSISEIIIKGKKALKAGGGLLVFKKKLVKNLNILSEKNEKEEPRLNLDDEYQCVLLDNWIEELLRFLALKTITGDITEPCQLLPGYAIGDAWKVLMTSPSLYSKVCLAMGNQHIFDHHPSDTAVSRVTQEKHKVKRYNATLRAYESFFDQQPPSLYWSFYPKEKEDDSMTSFLIEMCGCDTSFLSDPFANKEKKSRGMSPDMPVFV